LLAYEHPDLFDLSLLLKDLASGVRAVETITASLMRLLLRSATVFCLSSSSFAASYVDKEEKQGRHHQ
jgi:hypothetical protein